MLRAGALTGLRVSDSWNGENLAFSYDPLGRRTNKSVNGTATSYRHDGVDVVTETKLGYAAHTVHGPVIDQPIFRDGLYLTPDFRSSGATATDASGATVAQTSYGWYGETDAAPPTVFQSVGFTGREWDAGYLYHYRSRYYHPTWGRFLSEDPIGFLGGMNQYAYVENNPLNGIDPFGLRFANPADHIGGGGGSDSMYAVPAAVSLFGGYGLGGGSPFGYPGAGFGGGFAFASGGGASRPAGGAGCLASPPRSSAPSRGRVPLYRAPYANEYQSGRMAPRGNLFRISDSLDYVREVAATYNTGQGIYRKFVSHNYFARLLGSPFAGSPAGRYPGHIFHISTSPRFLDRFPWLKKLYYGWEKVE